MTPYYIAYAVLLACCAIAAWGGVVRLSLLIALIPMLIMISGRGLVGVDSAFYLQQFDVIRYGGLLAGGFEPGFGILVFLLTALIPDSFTVLVILGTATAAVLIFAALLLERAPVCFLMLIVPYFLFDMTMNGLRYGLAFSIVALGFAFWAREQRGAFIACVIIAASVQVSSVALVIGTWTLLEARFRTLIGIAAISAIAYYFFQDYLSAKLQDNTGLGAQGAFSGVIPLLVSLAFITSAAVNRELFEKIRIPILILILLSIVSFGLARFFYAGLRIQNLIIFMSYLIVSISYAHIKPNPLRKGFSVTILLGVAVLSSGLRLKNFSDEEGLGQSPFAPFYFASELAG